MTLVFVREDVAAGRPAIENPLQFGGSTWRGSLAVPDERPEAVEGDHDSRSYLPWAVALVVMVVGVIWLLSS